MQVTNTFQFEQEVDRVFQFYTDADLIIKKLEALGARNIEVEIEEGDNEIHVVVSREVALELPGPLKKFAQPWNKVTQKEIWTGSTGGPYYGEMEIITEGIPLTVSGQMKIAATSAGSAVAVLTDIDSNIPFLGKTITKFAGQASEEAVEEELEYISKNA